LTRVTQKAARIVFFLSAAASAMAAALVFGFLLVFGFPLIGGGEFFSLLARPWSPGQGLYGFLPMITGTAAISFLSIVFALPLSLGTVCFMGGLGPARISRLVDGFVRFMTGIPTVIYGFLGIFLLVPVVRTLFTSAGSGMCILSASLMLSLLVSPTMIIFFKDGFDSVDVRYIQAADALGADSVQRLIYVILPEAWPGIVTGIIMGLGRAMGDTLIALMIAGNAVHVPGSILDSARTLTSHIALVSASDYDSLAFKSIFACGLTLYVLNAFAVIAVRRLGGKRGQAR
jgi:phosphate transport system permease protein